MLRQAEKEFSGLEKLLRNEEKEFFGKEKEYN